MLVINLIIYLQICHDNKSSAWIVAIISVSAFKQISPFQQMEEQNTIRMTPNPMPVTLTSFQVSFKKCKIDETAGYALGCGYTVIDEPVPGPLVLRSSYDRGIFSFVSSKYGHFWLQKSKMAMAIMPNSRQQHASPQTCFQSFPSAPITVPTLGSVSEHTDDTDVKTLMLYLTLGKTGKQAHLQKC